MWMVPFALSFKFFIYFCLFVIVLSVLLYCCLRYFCLLLSFVCFVLVFVFGLVLYVCLGVGAGWWTVHEVKTNCAKNHGKFYFLKFAFKFTCDCLEVTLCLITLTSVYSLLLHFSLQYTLCLIVLIAVYSLLLHFSLQYTLSLIVLFVFIRCCYIFLCMFVFCNTNFV